MKIYLGSDHAGFELKTYLMNYLDSEKFIIKDCGPYDLDPLDDYPDFIFPVAKNVASDNDSVGIIMGGSGQGEAIAANRIKGVRAAVYYGGPIDIIKYSKLHNNANILSLGARFVSKENALEVINIWLNETFEKGRHLRRINKLDM